ncbi:HPP family protein [Leptolyngbya sp. FACHB-16]|nr:HPP family protein [Leptolyngbya sp. FACHB-8]MBD2154922.1 HPP family protein [Leptolyngbya sp. FACHB-16]
MLAQSSPIIAQTRSRSAQSSFAAHVVCFALWGSSASSLPCPCPLYLAFSLHYFRLSLLLGPGYWAAGCAMVLTIILMILMDVVHPPAVSTSLSFALRVGNENNLILFGLAVGITATLVVLERISLWILAQKSKHWINSQKVLAISCSSNWINPIAI